MLQYMKKTTLDNPEIRVKDERILELDEIVQEVKESKEWEAVRMSILSIGMDKGIEVAKKVLRLSAQGMTRGGNSQAAGNSLGKGEADN